MNRERYAQDRYPGRSGTGLRRRESEYRDIGNAADLGRESRGQDAFWHFDNRIACREISEAPVRFIKRQGNRKACALGEVTFQKPRLAACTANAGSVPLIPPGGKWRRALPARDQRRVGRILGAFRSFPPEGNGSGFYPPARREMAVSTARFQARIRRTDASSCFSSISPACTAAVIASTDGSNSP